MTKFDKSETKRLLKVKDTLEDIYDNDAMRKYGIKTPFTVAAITATYNQLIDSIGHSADTVFSDVKKFFESRGFFIERLEDGIGWRIYISERIKKRFVD